MKKINTIILLLLMALTCSSCAVVGGIFKAGIWTGIIIVAVILFIIIYLITRSSNK